MFRVGSPKVVIFGCILGRGWHTFCKSPELCGPCTLCCSYSGLLLSPQSIPRQHVSDESGRVPFTRTGGPGLADPCYRSQAQKLGVAGDLNHCSVSILLWCRQWVDRPHLASWNDSSGAIPFGRQASSNRCDCLSELACLSVISIHWS